MRTIIAGTRTIEDYRLVEQAVIDSGFNITQVISGGARGVDRLGERWARQNHVPVLVFPADWEKHGNAAGFIRNVEMAEVADALIAVTSGSPGTLHMIATAEKKGLDVFIKRVG
jgi:hypothetical protein